MPRRLLPWALALAGVAGLRLLRFRRELRHAARFARTASAFQRELNSDDALLVIGDSLAVGVGAERPEDTVAGRFAAEFPGLAVVNRARSGARARDVLEQLQRVPERRYVAVMVAVGANDAIAATPLSHFERQLGEIHRRARALAPVVVHVGAANIGGAPLFFWPLDRILEWRMRRTRDIVERVCRRNGVRFIDFFRPRAVDRFSRFPHRYYGPDRVHPSSRCYALCHRLIARRAGLGTMLRRMAAD
jgi:lysophospholipase L1-like esterase